MACDIAFFISECIATNESSEGAADGEITVLATASSGTIKYSLGSDFDYASGSTTATFTGLVAGLYTIYARSSAECLAVLDMSVSVTSTYAVRYTNRYYAIGPNATHIQWTFNILKRDYTGDPETIQGKAFITWGTQGSENPFEPILTSQCRLELLSTEDEQFLELYTDDEREFKVTVSGGEVAWTGYLLTGQYAAPYDQLENYTVTVLAADMLENLKDIPFGNSGGSYPQARMSILQGIAMAISHTDLELQFYDGVQFVVTGVSNTFDDTSAIDVVYFDPEVYNQGDEPESCFAVLEGLLKSLGARIYQTGTFGTSRWIIESITLKPGGTFNVRVFDHNGGLLGSGETKPRVMIRRSLSVTPRVCFMDRSQMMKITETFGTVNIVYDYTLDAQNNILVNGSFDAEVDIENGQFLGWSCSSPDPTPQLASATDATGTRTVLKIPFDPTQALWAMNIFADPVPLTGSADMYQIRISFDIFASPIAQGHYLYFDLSAMIEGGSPDDYAMAMPFPSSTDGANALIDSAAFSTYLIDSRVATDYEFIRFYIDEVNTWKTMTFFFTVDPAVIGSQVDGDFQLKFHISGNPTFDHADTAALKAEVTAGVLTTQTYNNRRRIPESAASAYLYRLEPGVDAESLPDIVRPDDFHSVSNRFVWKLQGTIVVDATWDGLASYFLLDNVVCQYLPLSAQPEASETEVAIIRENTKFNLDVAIKHADLPTDQNYQNMTKGWLSFSDGSPTETWKIRPATGASPAKPLIEHLADMYRGQYSEKRWKLTGAMDTQVPNTSFGNTLAVSPFNSLWEVRNGKVYLPTYMMVDTKNASVDVELIETLQGEPMADDTNLPIDPSTEGPEPPDPAAGRIHVDAYAVAYI